MYGGRDFTDQSTLWSALSARLNNRDVLIEGGCRGADRIAWHWWLDIGSRFGVALEEYWVADHPLHLHNALCDYPGRYIRCGEWRDAPPPHGRRIPSAGPKRNSRMLRDGKPTDALECPGGRGTADMRARLLRAGVPVLYLEPKT